MLFRSPPAVEREATHRAIALSELVDVPILIVHVSGGEAFEQIRRARERGLNIHAETCPQYLLLTAAHLGAGGYHGAKCVCSPPPRDEASQQQVWRALADGDCAVFSSDHAPFRYEDPQGKKPEGREVAFPHIPNGIPGLETRLPLLFSEGVLKGRIDLHRFVALTAANPARMYGLYPQKGTLAVGSDADLVVWDAQREVTIANAALHHAVDYTPYEGLRIAGWPAVTFSRGEVVYEDGRFTGRPGHGRFIPCAPYFRNPRHIPFFARNTLPLLSCLVSSLWARNGRRLTGREFVWMATLNGWQHELVQQAASPNAIVLLDQGPVFLLTELYVFGPKSLRGRSAMKWWQTAFQDWANTLDLIIWLDAADRILIERIQARYKWHVMKGKQEDEIIQFLGEYRQAYEDVISMLLLNSAHLEILRLDTSLETIEVLEEKLLLHLEDRVGFHTSIARDET